MTQTNTISLGKIKTAYGLKDADAIAVLSTLWPQSVYPLNAWREAFNRCWKEPLLGNCATHKLIAPAFPQEKDIPSQPYYYVELYRIDVQIYFGKFAPFLDSQSLWSGLEYLLHTAYVDMNASAPYRPITELIERFAECEKQRGYTTCSVLQQEEFIELAQARNSVVGETAYLEPLFYDAIELNAAAAVAHLAKRPLITETAELNQHRVQELLQAAR